jgi:hypothetical protein
MYDLYPLSLSDLRNAYAKGENIVQLLADSNPTMDRQEVIEIAYDIQSGSYIKAAAGNPERLRLYANEIFDLCGEFIGNHSSVLDCGAGELTTLSALSQHLPEHTRLLACDISLSRLRAGRQFAEQAMRADLASSLELFVADMGYIPIADHSVDVVFTSHALEPNHGREAMLIKELLRIARHYLILFEPSWEHSSEAIRARMAEHGYIRNLPRHINDAGGTLLSVQPLPNPLNPLNPTYCYIVKLPANVTQQGSVPRHPFQCPRSGFPLQKRLNYWFSAEGGWAYPVLEGISCLRTKHAVLMSHG